MLKKWLHFGLLLAILTVPQPPPPPPQKEHITLGDEE
jgi:hypothetical protein